MDKENGRLETWHKEFRPVETSNSLSEAIETTVRRLSASAEDVVLVEFPETGLHAQELLLRGNLFGEDINSLNLQLDELSAWHNSGSMLLNHLSLIENVYVQPVYDPLCVGSSCSVIVDAKPMYTDLIHPSQFYTDIIARSILGKL